MRSQQENVKAKGSSKKAGSKILGVITRKEAERLLLDWVNLPDAPLSLLKPFVLPDAVTRMRARYPGVLPEVDDTRLNALLSIIRDHLRKAWDAHDLRHRDWYLFQVRNNFHKFPITQGPCAERERTERMRILRGGDLQGYLAKAAEFEERLTDPPSITPFEATIFYLQTAIGDRAKHCGGPDCLAPYFIATRRVQKYCSEKCAGPASRESKRKWWHENRMNGGSL